MRIEQNLIGRTDELQIYSAAWFDSLVEEEHMPGMDGYELTRRLRDAEAEHGGSRMPVVAVTANAMRGEEERCLAAGMDAYLAKPVAIDRLRATLESGGYRLAMARRQANRRLAALRSTAAYWPPGSATTMPASRNCWRSFATARSNPSRRSTWLGAPPTSPVWRRPPTGSRVQRKR